MGNAATSWKGQRVSRYSCLLWAQPWEPNGVQQSAKILAVWRKHAGCARHQLHFWTCVLSLPQERYGGCRVRYHGRKAGGDETETAGQRFGEVTRRESYLHPNGAGTECAKLIISAL